MPANNPAAVTLIVDRFESAWRAAPAPPEIDEFLAAAEPSDRPAVLRELVLVDLERRLRAREAVRVEDRYLDRYPDLKADPAWVVGLIVREFELRRPLEPGLSAGGYLRRFPQYADELRARLPPDGTPPTRVVLGPGTRIDTYELISELGGGGMGVVYRARHLVLNKPVALKVLSARLGWTPELSARFRREVEAAGRLEHPNLVRAMDAGEVNGTPFLVMELLDGADLQTLIWRRGGWPVAEACEAVRQAALGLQHAHEQELVHRDVKPSNLMLTPSGTVKVLDLGLAKLREDGADGLVTAPGQMMGTPDFMAPEQWLDCRTADARSDLYSLGCTLFALLAGAPPFGDSAHVTPGQKQMAHVGEPPPDVRRTRADVSADLAAVLARLLAKKPQDRYATAAELAADLAPFAAGARPERMLAEGAGPGSTVRPVGTAPASPPGARRWRLGRRGWLLAAGGALAGAVGLGAAAWWWHASGGDPSVEALDVLYWKPRPDAGPLGPEDGLLGWPAGKLPRGYLVRVVARFSAPAHCYLVSLFPDGQAELWHPARDAQGGFVADRDTPPAATRELFCPARGAAPLKQLGVQAFVLVASARPLPSFAQWEAAAGPLPWQPVAKGLAWRGTGRRMDPIGGDRGDAVEVADSPVWKLRDFLQQRPEVTAFITFPVVEK